MGTETLKRIWPQWELGEKPLGKGSYGTVYQAVRRENDVESHAAIKVITIPSDTAEIDSLRSEGYTLDQTRDYLQGVVKDFVSEIQLMESVKGVQNIVSVEDFRVMEKKDELGWEIFIRMELLTPFNAQITDKKMTEAEVIKLGTDICTALEVCGKRNIIHRDIKPENIFINDFGDYKLGDFGIARKMDNLSGSLSHKGTYNYMAPEVINGSVYDGRVDTYSLGIVLYRLLNGNRLPFLSEDGGLNPNERKLAVDRRMRGEQLPAPCDASPAMANLILKACAFDPAKRFASATQMKQALLAVAAGTYIPVAVADDGDKTQAVRPAAGKAPAKPAQNTQPARSSQYQPVQEAKKKKKSKAPLVITLLLILLIGIAVAVWFIFFSGGSLGTGGLTISKEQSEIQTYLKDAEGFAEEQAYEDALAVIQEGMEKYPDDASLQEKADAYAAAITEQKISKILFDADKQAQEGKYNQAIEILDSAIAEYPDHAGLKTQRQAYLDAQSAQQKSDILAQAAALAENGDYEGAIEVMQDALASDSEDADYQNAYEQYRKDLKDAALEEADSLSSESKYLEAADVLLQAQNTLGEDADLIQMIGEYEDAYAQDISAQVDQLLAENNVAAAKTLVQNAAKKLPDHPVIQELLEKVSGYQTVLLNNLKPINGGFTWNDGTPADPFKTDYTSVKNYAIIHADGHWRAAKVSAEYKLDKQYNMLTFTLSPYSDFEENDHSYVQVYVNDVLRYTSPRIEQKTQPLTVTIDISDAEYLKIYVYADDSYGCVMLSDVSLSNQPNFVSELTEGYTALDSLTFFNGTLPWNSEYPRTNRGDLFNEAQNYAVLHVDGHWRDHTYSAEWFLNSQYKSLSFNIAPAYDFGASETASIKVYADDMLVYTAPAINQKTAMFSTGEIDLTGVTYLKIVIELKADYGCVVISDALLKNAE